MHQKVLRLLREIKYAELDQDYPRIAAMRGEITSLSQSLDIPLAFGASVVLPNITPGRKSVIYHQLYRVLRSSPLKAWERQAVTRSIRVLRLAPHTVQTVFSKHATKRDWSGT